MIGELEQLLHVIANVRVAGLQLLIQSRQTKLQAEIRLNDAVVNVVRDTLTFLLRRVGGEIIDQPDVFHHGRHVVHQLQQRQARQPHR